MPTTTRTYGAALALTGASTALLARRGAAHLGTARLLPAAVLALGLRQAVQGAALVARPGRATAQLALAGDLLHLTSLLPISVAPRWRRFAVISGACTAGCAAVEAALLSG